MTKPNCQRPQNSHFEWSREEERVKVLLTKKNSLYPWSKDGVQVIPIPMSIAIELGRCVVDIPNPPLLQHHSTLQLLQKCDTFRSTREVLHVGPCHCDRASIGRVGCVLAPQGGVKLAESYYPPVGFSFADPSMFVGFDGDSKIWAQTS